MLMPLALFAGQLQEKVALTYYRLMGRSAMAMLANHKPDLDAVPDICRKNTGGSLADIPGLEDAARSMDPLVSAFTMSKNKQRTSISGYGLRAKVLKGQGYLSRTVAWTQASASRLRQGRAGSKPGNASCMNQPWLTTSDWPAHWTRMPRRTSRLGDVLDGGEFAVGRVGPRSASPRYCLE
jgi:hypothetical protein